MGRASALVCLIWKIRPSTATREPYYNSIHPFATNSIGNTRVLTKWLKKSNYEIREIQDILVHLEVSTYYLVEYEKSNREKVGKKQIYGKNCIIQILPHLCFLVLTGRPVISLFMKTDFLFVGNLLCIIWEICFILFGQICLSRGFASKWRTQDHQRRSLSIHAAHDDND